MKNAIRRASVGRLTLFSACLILLAVAALLGCHRFRRSSPPIRIRSTADTIHEDTLHLRLINPTFLGNEGRNFYGKDAPAHLHVIWKRWLGEGTTVISRRLGSRKWAGAGWTGQPLLVQQDTVLYLIQGAYDHRLKKIRADSGQIIWQYAFDDVIKGTGTLWNNIRAKDLKNRIVIIQGSRLGINHYLDAKHVPSLRAVSFFTGQELWRMDVKWTDSYSRDVDGSALIIRDTAYLAMENSLFTAFNPDYLHAGMKDSMLQPAIYREIKLYEPADVRKHRGNVVSECSSSRIGNMIYTASGSGHVYGYDMLTGKLSWDFYIGSDLDGSPVVTSDSCLLVSVERQYIEGRGGLFKLDPRNPPAKAAVWFLPVENKAFNTWEGGIIGSAGINDAFEGNKDSSLAAVAAIDGYLYVVNHRKTDPKRMVVGPDNKKSYPCPVVVFRKYIGPSISTPLFVQDKLIAAGYHGIKLFSYTPDHRFLLLDEMKTPFESTPFVWNKRIYIASRDGYMYCLGEKR